MRWVCDPRDPQNAAGTRMEPPMSLPSSSGVRPAASAALPAVLPPDMPRQVPGIVGSAVYGVVALEVGEPLTDVGLAEYHRPRRAKPPNRDRIGVGAMVLAAGTPAVDGSPCTSIDSLMVIGSPRSGPAAPRDAARRRRPRPRGRARNREPRCCSAPCHIGRCAPGALPATQLPRSAGLAAPAASALPSRRRRCSRTRRHLW